MERHILPMHRDYTKLSAATFRTSGTGKVVCDTTYRFCGLAYVWFERIVKSLLQEGV